MSPIQRHRFPVGLALPPTIHSSTLPAIQTVWLRGLFEYFWFSVEFCGDTDMAIHEMGFEAPHSCAESAKHFSLGHRPRTYGGQQCLSCSDNTKLGLCCPYRTIIEGTINEHGTVSHAKLFCAVGTVPTIKKYDEPYFCGGLCGFAALQRMEPQRLADGWDNCPYPAQGGAEALRPRTHSVHPSSRTTKPAHAPASPNTDQTPTTVSSAAAA